MSPDVTSPAPTLPEELLVLSYRADTRKRQFRARDLPGALDNTLRAAVIIELVESGQLSLVRQQEQPGILNTFGLRAVSAVPTGSPAHDALLAEVSDPKNAGKALGWWLLRGATERATTNDLIARGLVSERYKSFGPFTRDYRFEAIDEQFDSAIRDRFERVFFADQEPQRRDLLIAALLSYGWVWHIYAPLTDKTARERFHGRVESLAAREWPPTADGSPISAVLTALSFTHSGSGL